jgi:hypothetical protein
VNNFWDGGHPIVYRDETYIHISHTFSFGWSDDLINGLFASVTKDQRLIIKHAGSKQGFTAGAHL